MPPPEAHAGRGRRPLPVTMTVNQLGKIDLYQWLYFLAQHALPSE